MNPINRIASGVPAGGQFAASAKSESKVDISGPASAPHTLGEQVALARTAVIEAGIAAEVDVLADAVVVSGTPIAVDRAVQALNRYDVPGTRLALEMYVLEPCA